LILSSLEVLAHAFASLDRIGPSVAAPAFCFPALGIVKGEWIEVLDSALFEPLAFTGQRIGIAEVRLLPPVIPPTFYAAGVNYPSHLKSVAARKGIEFKLPAQSHIGYRAVNALTGQESPVVILRDSCGRLQFEGELVAVIGKTTRNVAALDALRSVFGYTIGNDISERQWQASDRTLWRAKNCDTFKPMGPWIETEVDLAALTTTIRVNGSVVSRFQTNDMIFGVAETIAEISRYITLAPGE
jgi:2-keto-4-pentenoate hydratase/2-oxohepta-3-ene-1,7-dioic acid hydratase in catechol pathway